MIRKHSAWCTAFQNPAFMVEGGRNKWEIINAYECQMFIYQFLGRHIRDTLLVFQQLNEVSHTDIVFSSEWGCQVLVHCVYAKIQIF